MIRCRRKRSNIFLLLSIIICLVLLFYFIVWYDLNQRRRLHGQSEENNKIIRSKQKKQTEYVGRDGIRVIVGHYVGDVPHKRALSNLSWAEINNNGFSPRQSAGSNGEPVFVNEKQKTQAKRLWHVNKFNLVASDQIPLNRSLPDFRKAGCINKRYKVDGSDGVSIVIIFHNEAWSTLLRTVHSVINRSPSALLKEIILVDDASNRTFLEAPLQDHMLHLGNVKGTVIRSSDRVGLIRARVLGANAATASILVFLDAHCEVTMGWLEPLVHRIMIKPSTAICPVIDIINDDTFAYVKSFALHWGGFNWNLHFRWFIMGRTSLKVYREGNGIEPYPTPTMAGGLFAISRKYFFEIGAYDTLMDIWGGENIELSLRIWMCGGSVEIDPCSHVGHVFRKATPYSFPRDGGVGSVLYKNLARVALIWMDDLKDFYFALNPQAKALSGNIDVRDRLALRDQLKCHNFQWYLEKVWPEHIFPTPNRLVGSLKHVDSRMCIQRPQSNNNQPSGPGMLVNCIGDTGLYSPQLMLIVQISQEKEKGYIMTDESVCLDCPNSKNEEVTDVRFQACSEIERQQWIFDQASQRIIHVESGKCMSGQTNNESSNRITLEVCSKTMNKKQQWSFEEKKWRE